MPYARSIALIAAVTLSGLAACDSGFSGSLLSNTPPETALSVRDESLLDNLTDENRLVSTVRVTWSGDDPDGYVAAYEVRFYDFSESPSAEELWTRTVQTDSLFLLPIRQGERTSDVAFEVRAIDDLDARDPTPARTVFPIKNSPPEIQLSPFELPPDTTFNVVSLSWTATDPDGPENLAAIEISFNDTLSFVSLPPDTEFVTFVVDAVDAASIPAESDAEVFLGRGFEPTGLSVPRVRLNSENTFYVRSVDRTDTTSTRAEHSWYVKAKTADVLFVNDFRRATHPTVATFHLDLLRDYLPGGTPIDVWDLTTPFTTGSSGSFPRSQSLPSIAQPALEQFLAGYDHIYWVSTGTTDAATGNNLPFVATVSAPFFDAGGSMIVHSPVGLPVNPEDFSGDAATLLLPLRELVAFPDSLRQTLRLLGNTPVTTSVTLPSTSQPLPQLVMTQFLLNTLPYESAASSILPLYETTFQYITRQGNRRGIWAGPNTVASMSADQRVALFTLPMLDERTGDPILVGSDGQPADARTAVHLILRSLGFPE